MPYARSRVRPAVVLAVVAAAAFVALAALGVLAPSDLLVLPAGDLALTGDFLHADDCYQFLHLAGDGTALRYAFPLPKPWQGRACNR